MTAKLTTAMITALNTIGLTGEVTMVRIATLNALVTRGLVHDNEGAWFLTSDAHDLTEVTKEARQADMDRERPWLTKEADVYTCTACGDTVLGSEQPTHANQHPTEQEILAGETDVASEAAFAEFSKQVDKMVERILAVDEPPAMPELAEWERELLVYRTQYKPAVVVRPLVSQLPAVVQIGRKLRWAKVVSTVTRDTQFANRHMLVVQLNGTHTRMLVEPASVAV